MEWWSIDLERIHYSVTPTLHHSNDLLFPRRRHPGMARASGEGTTARPLATDFAIVAGVNAKTRLEVIDAWSSIVGEFIAAHSAPVALRDGILYVRVLQPSLHYELERIAKTEILRKLKRRFGGKTIRDIRFRLG